MDRYEGCEAVTVPVTTGPASAIDQSTNGYVVVIGAPAATAYAVQGTIAELAGFAARVSDSVRTLAQHVSLADAQLADELGAALLALDAPIEEETTAADDDPLEALRALVAEAHDRLPCDEFGPLCAACTHHRRAET